jgi:CheY-like chemotaxis protein
MPLILAIESDRRQANQVTSIVRERLRAELVIADSAEKALAALGSRVPDLILTSTLLSAKDETALAERLRALEAAAAHVQTLTIPVLASTQPRSSTGRSMFSALLGDRHHGGHDGCDPGLFADQCKEYLQRAAAERAAQPVAIVEAKEEATVHPEKPAQKAVDPAPIAPMSEPEGEIDLSSMLDEKVVEQLTAAIAAVSSSQNRGQTPVAAGSQGPQPSWGPTPFAAVSHPEIPVADPAAPPHLHARMRDPGVRPTASVDPNYLDPSQCGFAALLAKLDEITHVASPLPHADSLAGSFDVSR